MLNMNFKYLTFGVNEKKNENTLIWKKQLQVEACHIHFFTQLRFYTKDTD